MRYLIAGLLTIAADQILKAVIRAGLETGQSIKIIGDFFKLVHVENPGVAFGMLSGAGWLLLLVPVVLVVAIVIYLASHRDLPAVPAYMLALIAAGGAANLIDRFAKGTVTDMFSFSIFPPVFNLADIAVTLGCFVLAAYILIFEKSDEKRGADR